MAQRTTGRSTAIAHLIAETLSTGGIIPPEKTEAVRVAADSRIADGQDPLVVWREILSAATADDTALLASKSDRLTQLYSGALIMVACWSDVVTHAAACLAARHVASTQDAEDIAAVAIARFTFGEITPRTFPRNVPALRQYIKGIVMRCCMHEARSAHRSRRREAEFALATPQLTNPTINTETPPIAEHIARLGDTVRPVVEHHLLRGLSLAETAAELGISPAAAKKRWQRGAKWLRRALADFRNDNPVLESPGPPRRE